MQIMSDSLNVCLILLPLEKFTFCMMLHSCFCCGKALKLVGPYGAGLSPKVLK